MGLGEGGCLSRALWGAAGAASGRGQEQRSIGCPAAIRLQREFPLDASAGLAHGHTHAEDHQGSGAGAQRHDHGAAAAGPVNSSPLTGHRALF